MNATCENCGTTFEPTTEEPGAPPAWLCPRCHRAVQAADPAADMSPAQQESFERTRELLAPPAGDVAGPGEMGFDDDTSACECPTW